MSDRRIDAEGERRLRAGGFVPEVSPTGKQRWQDPETGRMIPGANALQEAQRREEKDLEEAGWKREEVEGETYWRRPDSGRLYPRGPAHDLLKTREER
ncbi:MAG TPA: hypothetical protein VGP38_10685 [Rubrobacter sp.]|nr:hypothetical protein [Rubrobacter sp.]